MYKALFCYSAVLDAVVFIALLVIMKPLPEWAYPCIFYLQVRTYVRIHIRKCLRR